VRRHLSAAALGLTPLVAGSIQNATRPNGETRIPVSTLLIAGVVCFFLAEALAREPQRGERVLAGVAAAAVVGVIGGAMVAFAVVGGMLATSHGDPKVIEGSGALGLAIIRQWWIFSAVVFVLALAGSARWSLAGAAPPPGQGVTE
jgi:uncharacterized membrane protein